MSNLNKILQAPTIFIIYMTFLPTTPSRVRDIRVGGDGACALRFRDRQSICFQTFRHNGSRRDHIYFKFYYDLFYLDYKYKGLRRRAKPGVPENIHELLTPRALAYWFMDDGSTLSRKAKRYDFFFDSLISFRGSRNTCTNFKRQFFNLCKYSKALFLLHVVQSTNRLVDLIRPYRNPCRRYKIQNN